SSIQSGMSVSSGTRTAEYVCRPISQRLLFLERVPFAVAVVATVASVCSPMISAIVSVLVAPIITVDVNAEGRRIERHGVSLPRLPAFIIDVADDSRGRRGDRGQHYSRAKGESDCSGSPMRHRVLLWASSVTPGMNPNA